VAVLVPWWYLHVHSGYITHKKHPPLIFSSEATVALLVLAGCALVTDHKHAATLAAVLRVWRHGASGRMTVDLKGFRGKRYTCVSGMFAFLFLLFTWTGFCFGAKQRLRRRAEGLPLEQATFIYISRTAVLCSHMGREKTGSFVRPLSRQPGASSPHIHALPDPHIIPGST
jgi:hypothetical protein